MTFTQIPPEYAPLSGELRYTVTTQETATLDLRIADAGNGTLIGASANVVLSGISAKHGHPITFGHYLKVGFPTMVLSVAISTVYLLVRFH